MARPRSQLHEKLKEMVEHVYFQPPESVKLQYPCIIYQRDDVVPEFADNIPIRTTVRYQVTVIDQDPDSDIPAKVAALPMCRFDRHYRADHLNHDVYNIFF